MQPIKKRFAMLLSLFAIVTAFGSGSHADYYAWSNYGRCNEYGEDGLYKREVADFHCGPDKKAWASDGYCYEYSGAGRQKRMLPDYDCGRDTHAWDQLGRCIEYAGSGRYKGRVPDANCPKKPRMPPQDRW